MKWSPAFSNQTDTLAYLTLFMKYLMDFIHYPPLLNPGRAVLVES